MKDEGQSVNIRLERRCTLLLVYFSINASTCAETAQTTSNTDGESRLSLFIGFCDEILSGFLPSYDCSVLVGRLGPHNVQTTRSEERRVGRDC